MTRPYEIARQMLADLMPHEEGLQDVRLRFTPDLCPAEENRLQIIEAGNIGTVSVGDLVTVINHPAGDYSIYHRAQKMTAHEYVLNRGSFHLYRVEAVTAKSLRLEMAEGQLFSDPKRFGLVCPDVESFLIRPSAKRTIFRLGSATRLREAMQEHRLYPEWVRIYTDEQADEKTRQDEKARRAEEEASRVAPLKAAVTRLNELAGEVLVILDYLGRPAPAVSWLAEGDRLRTYIRGALAHRPQSLPEAMGCLKTLGL